jgi:hypothetical protein
VSEQEAGGMKKIILVLVLLFALPLAGHAENKGESKLMALVGMRIPPVVPYKKQGKIPRLNVLRGFLLISNDSTLDPGIVFGYIGNEGGFVLDHREKDLTRTVLDARVLPLDLLRFDLKGGKHVWRKDDMKKYSVFSCEKTGIKEAIIGLMRPEQGKEGCQHDSRQVKMAWRVNEKTRKLEEISPKGIVCFFTDAEDICL